MPELALASDPVLDVVAGVFLFLGGFLAIAGAVGLIRFPDALSRLHAATKPQILGLVFIVVAIALASRTWYALLVLAPVVVFQLLVAPVAAHMIARAGYRTKNHRRDLLYVDELEAAVERADRAGAERSDDDRTDDSTDGGAAPPVTPADRP